MTRTTTSPATTSARSPSRRRTTVPAWCYRPTIPSPPPTAGGHTFTNSLKLVTAGGQTVTIRDTAYITGQTITTASLTIKPGQASTLQVTGFPSTVTAGNSGTFTVTARDAYGNVATG